MRMSKQQRIEVLRELSKVIHTRAERRPGWFRPDYGLCGNYMILSERRGFGSRYFNEDFKHQIKTWPLWTKDDCFMVPGRAGTRPGILYDEVDDKYNRRTVYAKNRFALLDHVIKEYTCPSAN